MAVDGPTAPAGRLPRRGLSIQSKLLAMLLAVSVLATLVVGVIGYRSGTDSLRDAAFDQLTQLRDSRAREMERLVAQMANAATMFSRGQTTVEATREFEAGFRALDRRPVAPADRRATTRFYAETFVPGLERREGERYAPAPFLPDSPAQSYLQARYTAPADGDWDRALAVDDAGDGTAWSRTHATFHDYFRNMVERFGFEDALIVDRGGRVVYSAYKGVDLGTDLERGPYRTSALAEAFHEAVGANNRDEVVITDFAEYQPSLGMPVAWVLSPIGSRADETIGVLALQVPLDAINEVMTGEREWEADGLGETGETFLAGTDLTMRSISRLLVQDPERFQREVVAAGTPPSVAEREVQVGGSILLQPVDIAGVERALREQSGTTVAESYTGAETLMAYAPLELPDLDWVIVATLDTDEAFSPVDDFAAELAFSIAAIILVVSLLSIVLAQLFTRPLRRLAEAVRGVAAGNLGVEVPIESRDEIGDLGVAFNDMSRSLAVKQELLDRERAENERLLLSLMPAALAERYRAGERGIASEHHDAAVIYAEVAGFDALAARLDSAASLSVLDDLVRSFDDAAERLGVEPVRTLRSGFLGSCGLTVPRVDPVRRTLDLAVELQRIVDRFNAQHDAGLTLRAGVDAGPVSSGLIGRSSVVYDLWGEAVDLAYRVGSGASAPGIFVSQRVRDDLGDARRFVPADDLPATGSDQVWRLELDADRV